MVKFMDSEGITQLLTENHEQSNQQIHTVKQTEQAQAELSSASETATHAEQPSKEMPSSEVFPTILGHLGNHNELTFFDVHITDLPVIIYDKKEGFHAYASIKKMEQGQLFTSHHGHAPFERAADMQPVTLDLSITSLLVFQWIAALIIVIIFAKVGRAYKKRPGKTPKGLQTAIEALVVYIRDEVIYPNCGSQRVADMLFPYFIALFFFILACNLLGLVP